MSRIAIGGALAIGVLAAACTGPEPRWNQEQGYRWRPLAVRSGKAGFTSLTTSGIQFQNTVSESALVGNRVLAQGAGVALGDIDNDGLVDVFLARTQGCNALYRNRGGWRFEDVAQRAGVAACDRHSSGAAFADVDGNGSLDLILLATTGPNAMFLNDGGGVFTERRDLGLDTVGRGGTTIAMADIDGDARLDLYVANYKAFSLDDSIPPQQRAFNQMVRQIGRDRFEVVPARRGDYKIVMRPDMGGLRMTARAEPDDFYRNDGSRFVRASVGSGRFLDANGKVLTEEPESFGLTARFADLDADGAPDLYVANDFEDTDELWFNDGHGILQRADWRAQRQISSSSMGIDISDMNGDGLPDIFAVDMLSNDSRRLKTQIPTHTALPKRPGDFQTQLQQQRNTLFANRGDRTFSEVAQFAGVQASGWSWSTLLMDADLDGWQDIFITTGHLWDIMDADTHERLQSRLTAVDWRRWRWEFPRLALPNVAYRNRGDMTFEDVSAKWRFGIEDDVSHAQAAGDLDGDGDLDIIVSRFGSPALVLRNDASAPRIAVRLVGDPPNTRAVGAKIRLVGGAVPIQEREVTAGGLYLSHSDYEASFAMGRSDRATLIVGWRDGRQTVVEGVRPNRKYEVTAATAKVVARAQPPRMAPPLFADATPELGGHAHAEPAFDDWEQQFLLPNALSQLGPGIAWFDFDRDGDEDLFVGAGRAGQLGVFRNEHGRLAPRPDQGPRAVSDFAGVLGLAGGGKTRVLVGLTSWEGGVLVPGALAVETSKGGVDANGVPLIPPLPSSAGPIALADYDSDGDLDLFVGGRAVPGQYPRDAPSFLFRHDGATFVRDSINERSLGQVGLVSAATFADIDGDGDADLILAREWDSILLLLNERGRFTQAPGGWGLDQWTSRWNGIATGDLDGDGRLDLVATSWGRNTAMQATRASPLVMWHGPIGSAAEEEMLVGRQDTRLRAIAPLNSYARVRIAIPGVSDRVRTFAEYGDATIENVLGAAKSKVRRRSINTLEHMVFWNRGERFEGTALPLEAQLAPAFYAGIADFDGDGAEDLFLSQNFSATAVGLPRYDEGRGLLLSGDGKGHLAPMSAARSGVAVYGDQRGAAYADVDDDGRLDLVVSQNGAETRFFRNRGAAPGLRVRLRGGASNPDAVGAQVRLDFGSKMSALREIQAGSGYWSQNGAVQVFGVPVPPTAVWVRWPGGVETRVAVPTGAREIAVTQASP